MKRGGSFWSGLTSGLLFSLLGGTALLLVLNHADLVKLEMNGLPELSLLLGWLERNFGLSLIPFSATLLLYLLSLNQLAKKLAQQRPQDEID
ncbi:MAG: hypothetical protein GY934_25215, partial [Gammaproteobacteria bacterium]|nr:hypothetical protein [Gammaproteobacteria bacterium]